MNQRTENEESIVAQVRRLKEGNAARHGYDLRAILAAARAGERAHPERMVTRIPTDEDRMAGVAVRSRPVQTEDEP